MSPADAQKLVAEAKEASIKRAGMVDLERRFKRIQKAADGARVQVALAGNGLFFAHVYPSAQHIGIRARERLKTMDPATVGTSTFSDLVAEEERKSVANANGKTLDAALAGLERFYGIPVKAGVR